MTHLRGLVNVSSLCFFLGLSELFFPSGTCGNTRGSGDRRDSGQGSGQVKRLETRPSFKIQITCHLFQEALPTSHFPSRVGWALFPPQYSVLSPSHFSVPVIGRCHLLGTGSVPLTPVSPGQSRSQRKPSGDVEEAFAKPGAVLNTSHLYVPCLIWTSSLCEVTTVIILIL